MKNAKYVNVKTDGQQMLHDGNRSLHVSKKHFSGLIISFLFIKIGTIQATSKVYQSLLCPCVAFKK